MYVRGIRGRKLVVRWWWIALLLLFEAVQAAGWIIALWLLWRFW